jgi:predicted O-methyltransferase YrrM
MTASEGIAHVDFDRVPVDALMDSSLSDRVSLILKEALERGRVQHPDGTWRKIGANISFDNSRALSAFVRDRHPQLVVEIGMGFGVSTLSILEGLSASGAGRLISIDPYIGWQSGRAVALHQVKRSGLEQLHEHMDECSHTALPRLLDQARNPDIVYIDGWHNFDYAFTDFFYADKLLRPGGVVVFNDAGWRSVFKVIRFLQKFRRYRELEVGLPKRYTARNPLFALIKRLEGRSTCDRYFEKVEDWEPPSGFHRSF